MEVNVITSALRCWKGAKAGRRVAITNLQIRKCQKGQIITKSVGWNSTRVNGLTRPNRRREEDAGGQKRNLARVSFRICSGRPNTHFYRVIRSCYAPTMSKNRTIRRTGICGEWLQTSRCCVANSLRREGFVVGGRLFQEKRASRNGSVECS